jgi:hypothetical protein
MTPHAPPTSQGCEPLVAQPWSRVRQARARLPMLGLAAGLALTACTSVADSQAQAKDGAGAADPGVMRVICTTTTDRLADEHLTIELARAAGLGVQHVQALNARTFAVSFRCTPDERCQQGLARLQAARPLVQDVTVDGLRTRPRPPGTQESR